MPYYPTIEEDLARAKAILEKGKPDHPPDWFEPSMKAMLQRGGGTIYGADVYAAYKLLESFVAEIETKLTYLAAEQLKNEIGALEAQVERQREELLKANEKVEALRDAAEQLQKDLALSKGFVREVVEGVLGVTDWKGSLADAREQMSGRFAALTRDYDDLHTTHREVLMRLGELEQRHARQALTIQEKTDAWRQAQADVERLQRMLHHEGIEHSECQERVIALEADAERERLARRVVDEALRQALAEVGEPDDPDDVGAPESPVRQAQAEQLLTRMDQMPLEALLALRALLKTQAHRLPPDEEEEEG